MGFVVDQGTNSWQAVKNSFRVTRGNTFRVFIMVVCQLLSMFVGVLLFLFGLIWAIPFAILIYGEVYKRLLHQPTAASN